MTFQDLSNGAGETVLDINDANADAGGDAALEALYDDLQLENGSERAADGKFTSTAADDQTGEDGEAGDGDGDGDGQTGDQLTDGQEDAKPAPVPLPANLRGLEQEWAKIPADAQVKLAEHHTRLQQSMSDQGRQIAAFKPISDVIEKNRDLFDGKTMADGSPVEVPFAVGFLMDVQRQIDQNPIATLIAIADRYGARNHLAAVLNGQVPIPQSPNKQSAGLTPAEVQSMIKDTLSQEQQETAGLAELSRLSKDKPLYSEIPEDDMVHSIRKARTKLGDTASHDAVFDLAYDMAVHADPALRAKAAAAKAAAAADPKREEAARRAGSVNVKSSSTGKTRQLTEDELLSAAYDTATRK